MNKYKQGSKAYASMPVKIKNIDTENFTLEMTASTQDVDRHGDTVIQSGWILDQFNENPVILNSHNYGDATEVIARAIKTEIVGVGKKSKLVQTWKFAVQENPKAKIIFELYAGGFLSASSVGFIPKKFKQNKDGSTDYWTIEEAELLEVSAVSVPANARALAKQKGIDVEILSYDEENTDDANSDDSVGSADEVSNTDQVQSDDEETVTGDGDSNESGSEIVKSESEGDTGSQGDETIVSAAEVETPTEEVAAEAGYQTPTEAKSVKTINVYARVLKKMNDDEVAKLKRVQEIINSLLKQETKSTGNEVTDAQIQKRKVNQAIRTLLQVK